jgi:uncharacterized membrane protein
MNPRRTEALSDSTFAVAMTLLIFDLRVSEPNAKHSLSYYLWHNAWPHYLGYVVSFLIIGLIWISHHTIFRLLHRVDHRAMVLNLALLSLVVFIPFPTQILAVYISHGSAVEKTEATAFYGTVLTAATFMLAVLWHSVRHRSRLIQPWVSEDELRRVTRRFYLTPVMYLAATGLTLINARLGILLFFLVGSAYVLHTGTRVAPLHPDDVSKAATITHDQGREPESLDAASRHPQRTAE